MTLSATAALALGLSACGHNDTNGSAATGAPAGGAARTSTGGIITSTSNDGYGGAVKVSVGITSEGQVNGIAFLSISETAGLGMNATKPKFYEQYARKTVESFNVVKVPSSNDNDINAISGATITSRTVTAAVNAALYFAKNCISQ